MGDGRVIYTGRIIELRQEDVTLPGGKRVTLDIVHHPGAAAIVAVDDQQQVILLRQYRHAANGFIWEVPAGTLGKGEEPAACAARELEEETGLVAKDWTPLGSVLTSPGFCDERIHLFLARQLSSTAQALDQDEVLTVERFPIARVLAMIDSGEIEDAKSIAALHRALPHLRSP